MGGGSILQAGYRDAHFTCNNCNFEWNYALQGGLFYVDFGSVAECNNCTMINTVAVRGGVAFLINDGSVQFTNVTIHSNQAMDAPLIFMSITKNRMSYLTNVTINDNTFVTFDDFAAKTGMSWVQDEYITTIDQSREFLSKSIIPNWISSISMT